MTEYLDVHDTIDKEIYREITTRCGECGELTLSFHQYCRPCYFEVMGYNEKYNKKADVEQNIKQDWKKAQNWEPGL